MRRVSPAYIPRNHLVEAALTAASDQGTWRRSIGCYRSFNSLTRISPARKNTNDRRNRRNRSIRRSAEPERGLPAASECPAGEPRVGSSMVTAS